MIVCSQFNYQLYGGVRGSEGITKVNKAHPLGTTKVHSLFHSLDQGGNTGVS